MGVTLSRQFDRASGWSFTPKMDLGSITAAGDVETKSRTGHGLFGTMRYEF